MDKRPKILIVDDEPFNVDYLEQELEDLSCDTVSAANGQEALAQVAAQKPDLILLDIMMPILDGFEVLARLKASPATRDIPVIVISAMHDIQSVVKGIKQGAEDYLPKPFDPVLLQARISTSLDRKRYRDQELEYLRQVEHLTDAAVAVEESTFDAQSLSPVAARRDALGNLARVFQRMAREVHAREQRLKQQLQQLQLDIEERQKASAETVAAYIPMDRRQALARGQTLPERTQGAALFADVSGFTRLAEALARELGFQRGAEELTRQLNRVYAAVIDEVHGCGGSVVHFSGDSITCWLDAGPARLSPGGSAGSAGLRATACALAMQQAMGQFATINTPGGMTISLAIKVAIVAGPVRRLLVGDPQIQHFEVLAGQTLDELARGEQQAHAGEVLAQAAIVDAATGRITWTEWRGDEASGGRFAVVAGLTEDVAPVPWAALPAHGLTEAQARPWLAPVVYEKARGGKGEFLSELRPAAVMFLKFEGIDYDHDDEAGAKLDAFVRWAQKVLTRHDGSLLQLTMGDKGSNLYVAFGAPVAHDDDALRAVAASLELQSPPAELNFVTGIQIGVAYGPLRAGAYGSPAQRTYGALGPKTNLAARLMQAASGGILCDEATYQAARSHLSFEVLPPIAVKGKAEPVPVYQPIVSTIQSGANSRIDRLSPAHQLTLKVASVIGRIFETRLLSDIYPVEVDKQQLEEHLQALEQRDLMARHAFEPESSYMFRDRVIQETAYDLMLFAQRRQLHRVIAEWHERAYAADLSPFYALLAHHWGKAEDAAKALYYLEKAGEQARLKGDLQEAMTYFNESLALDARRAVLSADYYAANDEATP